MDFPIDQIQNMIYEIRGVRVMLDSDLAKLYEIETGALNRQVKRNSDRFPDDFMFQLSEEEHDLLRCQIGISMRGKGGRRYQPLVFTESGVAMLSSVLKSKRAIQVNIVIMRTFIKLRSFLAMETSVKDEMSQLKKETNKLFKIVFERLDEIEEQIAPRLTPNRRKIGIKPFQK